MAAELSAVKPGTPVVHRAHHDLESFFYILLAICLLFDDPGKLKSPKVLSDCFDPYFSVSEPSNFKFTTIQSDFGWTTLIVPYISSYFGPLIPLLENIRRKLILPIKTHAGVLQANRDFTHGDFIDEIVTVLAKLPKRYWVPTMSNTLKIALPQNYTSSATSVPTTPSTTPSIVLPDNPIPRLPLIRMPGSSSVNTSKRRLENEDESSAPSPKRRSEVGETTAPPLASGSHGVDVPSPATSWTEIDVSSLPGPSKF